MPAGSDELAFLFTDIEGSTQLWEKYPDEMQRALALHDTTVAEVVGARSGTLFKQTGDGICVVFEGPDAASNAVGAAVDLQLRLGSLHWGSLGELRTRAGVHVGYAERREGDYFGTTLNRVARIMSAASGGQILVSQSVVEGVSEGSEVAFVDLGWHRFKGLANAEHVFHVAAPGLAALDELPAIKSLNPVRGNLPARDMHLVGREYEVVAVTQRLDESRVVSLVGPPGVGKTAVAVEASWRELGRYPDGVVYVDLTTVISEASIDDVVLAALAADPQGESRHDALLQHLRDRHFLLVLDNCEHVASSVGAFVNEVLATGRNVWFLATSRRRLGVPHELAYELSPLSVDEDGFAEQLFWERAHEVNPGLTRSASNTSAVRSVCRKLDGIPLALELAATRLAVLSPSELDELLDQRFRLLNDDSTQRHDRQRTLRATIDWSFNLLDDVDKSMLQVISVFSGGSDRKALEAVAEMDPMEIVGSLTRLVQNSLVRSEQSGDQVRYRLLETVREYGRDRLVEAGKLDEVLTRHAQWFCTFSERAGIALRGADGIEWVETVSVNLPNMRAALDFALQTGNVDLAARVVAGLSPFEATRWSQVAWWAGEVLALPQVDEHPLAMELHTQWAAAALFSSDVNAVMDRCQHAIEIANEHGRPTGGHVWQLMGTARMILWEWDVVVELMTSGVDAARESNDPYDLAAGLSGLALAEFYCGRSEDAIRTATECLAYAGRTGSPAMIANATGTLGAVSMSETPDRARTLLREAIAAADATDSVFHRMVFRQFLAILDWGQGLPEHALASFIAALEVATNFGDTGTYVNVSTLLVQLLAALRADTPAAVVAGALMFESVKPNNQEVIDSQRAVLVERMGPEKFQEAYAIGNAMSRMDLLAWLMGSLTDELTMSHEQSA